MGQFWATQKWNFVPDETSRQFATLEEAIKFGSALALASGVGVRIGVRSLPRPDRSQVDVVELMSISARAIDFRMVDPAHVLRVRAMASELHEGILFDPMMPVPTEQ